MCQGRDLVVRAWQIQVTKRSFFQWEGGMKEGEIWSCGRCPLIPTACSIDLILRATRWCWVLNSRAIRTCLNFWKVHWAEEWRMDLKRARQEKGAQQETVPLLKWEAKGVWISVLGMEKMERLEEICKSWNWQKWQIKSWLFFNPLHLGTVCHSAVDNWYNLQ